MATPVSSLNPDSCGPVLASGEVDGYAWTFRASIREQGFVNWFEMRHPSGKGSGGGADGGGLPSQGHYFGSRGWSGRPAGWVWWRDRHLWRRPTNVHGVVSTAVDRVVVHLSRDGSREALLLDVGHADARAFVAVLATGERWTELVALDAGGTRLERFARPRRR